MARFADIRVFIPSVMPLATYSEIAVLLNSIVNPKFDQFIHKNYKGRHEAVIRTDKDSYSIGKYNFLISDAKKALKEYQLLSMTVDSRASLLVSAYTISSIRSAVELEFLGDALGRVHSQLLKRAANWVRLGSQDPFVIEHKSPTGKKLHIKVDNLHKFKDSISSTIYYKVDDELIEVKSVDTPIMAKGSFSTFKNKAVIGEHALIIDDGILTVAPAQPKIFKEHVNGTIDKNIERILLAERKSPAWDEIVPDLFAPVEPKKSIVKSLLSKILPGSFFGAKV